MRLTFAAAMVFVLGCGGTTPPTDAAPPPTDGAPPPTDGAPPPTDGATTDGAPPPTDGAVGAAAFRGTRTVSIGGVTVDVLIDKPVGDSLDALVVYHGSVGLDSMVPAATATTLDQFRGLLDRDDVMLVSVAYPEQGRPFGDNLREAEAGLRWVREVAAAELGITLRRVFLGGHSQGGYLVTRLNTMHAVDGVVANAPGPLDLVYRCGLEERGQTMPSAPCNLLRGAFGTTTTNPEAYASRSLLRFTSPQRSRVLMVQGLADSAIQLRSWPMFREQLERCADCRERTFLEIPGRTHPALFTAPEGRAAFNTFLR